MKKVKFLLAAILVACLFFSCNGALTSTASVENESYSLAKAADTKASAQKRVVGYFCEWGIYAAHDNYYVTDIPFEKLTHINYAFVGLNPSTLAVDIYDPWATTDIVYPGEKWDTTYKGNLGMLRKMKEQYPHIKVLISVGGWTKSHGFHNAAATDANRKTAAKNLVAFMKQHGLDGVDIDWEYPGIHRDKDGNDQYDMGAPGGIEDKENFTLFLKAIREELDRQGAADGKYYELTAAIGVGYDKIAVTNPGDYHQYLDALNLMTYDMHGAFESIIGHQAPLYANPYDTHEQLVNERYNIDWAVNEFLRLGVPAEKIVLGLPFYSRGWNNVSGGIDMDGNGTPDGMFGTGGSTLAGKWGVGGQSPYFEVKKLESQAGWEKFFDPYSKASYLYNRQTKELYTYDDANAIKTKMNYIIDKGLGGAMYWELDGDDWKNGYDLVNIVADAMLGGKVPEVPEVTPPVVNPPANPDPEPENPGNPGSGTTDPVLPENPTVPNSPLATAVPGTPSLEQTSWNGESSFGLRMNMWWGNNGTLLELLENGVVVQRVTLEDKSPSAQAYTFQITGKANGTYTYVARLTNSFGSVESRAVNYTVTQGTGSSTPVNPQPPVVTPDPEPENPGNPGSGTTDPVLPPTTDAPVVEVEGLPRHILTGYWHNFQNGAKVLRISEVPEAYNIICVSFGESTTVPGEVVFRLDSSLGFSEAQFIEDIATAKRRGQHVILSVGGETGNVLINSDAAADKFASSITALMKKYGFEGVDIDLEHGINATYIEKALRKLPAGSIITMAPQTLDMQNPANEYFKLALAIKDILTVCNMQYYNSGSMLGYDGKVYSQGGEDFLVALATIQLENGLRPDQVGIGLPASTRGAGSGYVSPQTVVNALDTLAYGNRHGSYVPPKRYPSIRGAMTWSINWDASNNWEFSRIVGAKLAEMNGTELPDFPVNPEPPVVTPDPEPEVPQPENPQPENPQPEVPGSSLATGIPATPSIEQTSWNGDATFGINMNIWWGNNATLAELYENGVLVQSVTLKDNSPNPQTHKFQINNKANGTYTYKIKVSNSFGSTESRTISYTVTQGSASSNPVNPPVVNPPVVTPDPEPEVPEIPSYPELPEGPVNTSLPKRIMSGYWHTWNAGVPFIPLRNVDSSWDVINISFAEPVTPGSGNGQMKFVVSGCDSSYTINDFKYDVKLLQSKGKKVVLSIGGYEGYFSLDSEAAISTFVNCIKGFINEYGFDGIDIDLEQSSIQMNSGNDPDFRNPTSPKIVNMIKAIRQICDSYGDDFILSWAPETFYLQLGHQYYGGLNGYVDSRAGSYIPMIYALRDKTTYVQAQLYNSGSIVGNDGVSYSMGNEAGVYAMCKMLLEGFTVNGNANYFFPALRPDQVVIAVPCSQGAAGSGQISNTELQSAFRRLNAEFPGLRGIMTWSINWDALQNNNSFAQINKAFLNSLN